MEKLRVLLLVWVGLVCGVRPSNPKRPRLGAPKICGSGPWVGLSRGVAEEGSPVPEAGQGECPQLPHAAAPGRASLFWAWRARGAALRRLPLGRLRAPPLPLPTPKGAL